MGFMNETELRTNVGTGLMPIPIKQTINVCQYIPIITLNVAYITNEATDRQDKYLVSLIST